MSIVKTLEEAELAFSINYCSAVELLSILDELFNAHPEYRNEAALAALVRLNRKQQTHVDHAPDLLRTYLASHPIPPDKRPRTLEECGKALLKARLERYQESADLPVTVCQMVHAIELVFDYPGWLGDLYNACDWCKDDSSRDEFPSVRQQAELLVKML